MKKLLVILAMTTLCINAEVSTYEAAQKMKKIDDGQRVFRNKLQRKCGFTASHWAQQYTKSQWETFQANGAFKDELGNMCPRGIARVKDKWIEPLYLFALEYAKDTGKRPRC